MPEEWIPSANLLIVDDAPPPRVSESLLTVPDGLPNSEWHLGEHFVRVAAQCGSAPAIVHSAAEWTYHQLSAAAIAVAAQLRECPGFIPEARVLLLLANSPEYAAVFYGVLLAGGVAVPLPPRIESGTLQAIVESTQAGLIVTERRLIRARPDLQHATAARLCLGDLTREGFVRTAAAIGTGRDCLAAILFTAGSSGSPKGVMLSHGNLIANARAIQSYLRIDASDRPLCVLPFHHAFGNSVLQSHLLAGARLVIDGQPAFPETLIDALGRHECTSLSGVPELFRRLLDRTSLGQSPLPRLRYMAVAGGALARDAALEVVRRIAPAEFFVMYGQTEATARLAFVPPAELAGVPEGAIGRAIPGVTLEVVDHEGRPVRPGEIGELRARGANVMLGFWHDPVGTQERIRDGWLCTGDLATIQADGTIVLKGRRSELVKIAGYRVHPSDLEQFAVRRLSASQAVATAFESSGRGTRLALFLREPGGGGRLTVSQAMARCRAELPGYLVPDLIQFVDEFPLNHALKIDRPLLAQWAEREVASRRAPA